MHQDPFVLNHGRPGKGLPVVPGMCLAIEPMLTLGRPKTVELADGWTVVTADGSVAAHVEHTVALLDDGAWVLTAPDGGQLMLHLLRAATEFTWRDILEPQIPAVVCSAGLVAVAWLTAFAMMRISGAAREWEILLTQSVIAGIFYLLFLRFSGFSEVLRLVSETLTQISPKLARLARVPA
jgi:hypothetical protein